MSCHLNHDVRDSCHIFRKENADENAMERVAHSFNKHIMSTNFNFMHGSLRDWLLCGAKHTLETILRESRYAVDKKCTHVLPNILAKDN